MIIDCDSRVSSTTGNSLVRVILESQITILECFYIGQCYGNGPISFSSRILNWCIYGPQWIGDWNESVEMNSCDGPQRQRVQDGVRESLGPMLQIFFARTDVTISFFIEPFPASYSFLPFQTTSKILRKITHLVSWFKLYFISLCLLPLMLVEISNSSTQIYIHSLVKIFT